MVSSQHLSKCMLLGLMLLNPWCASGEVRLASIFADHMVLQRDARIPVWGWANAEDIVTVQLAGQTRQTRADAGGNWRVWLEPMVSGEPLSMQVTAGNTIEIKDILIGEVWLCSGQSNMGVTVQECYNAAEEMTSADYPQIRLYDVERRVCSEPDKSLGGSWTICSQGTVANFTAVGYFFARDICQRLKVPVGLVHASWGGTPAEAWTGWEALLNNPELADLIERFESACRDYPQNQIAFEARLLDWEHKVELARQAGLEPPPKPFITPMGPMHFQRPSGLYNGMILSLVPYPIRGVLWYQGECNAGRGLEYAHILPTMINNWRQVWDQGDIPFYLVQISSWGRLQDYPNELSGWARVREAQAQTADQVTNCHLVVTLDIGDADSNHPRNKQEVGKRLALAALANEYGEKDISCQGPTFKCMAAEDGCLRLQFDHTEGQLVSKLSGFVIAGKDLIYDWADARIEGDTVVLSSPKVPHPVAVRYAWANNPPCNLYNRAGLPAVPFRAQLPGLQVITAAEDTYLDESNPDMNFGCSMDLRIEDEGTPKGRRFTLIRWDLAGAGVTENEVEEVTLQVTQTDGYVGDGVEIYAIKNGDWKEKEITWNRWQEHHPELVFLGAIPLSAYPDGLSTFSSRQLTDWVKQWIRGDEPNHGLLLKYHHIHVYTGDTLFASGDPEALYNAPQLIIHSINSSIPRERR